MKCVLSFFCFGLPGVFEFVVREEVPNGKPIWVCKVCNFQANRKNHTVEHYLYKHAPDENIPCKWCGKIFNKRPTMRKHMIKCKRKYVLQEESGMGQVAGAPPVHLQPPGTGHLGSSITIEPMILDPSMALTNVPNPLLQ